MASPFNYYRLGTTYSRINLRQAYGQKQRKKLAPVFMYGSTVHVENGTGGIAVGGTAVEEFLKQVATYDHEGSGGALCEGVCGVERCLYNDGIGGVVSGTATVISSASFIVAGRYNQGKWYGTFGSEGYQIALYPPSLPSYVSLTAHSDAPTWDWGGGTQAAIQSPTLETFYDAVTYYAFPVAHFTIDFNDNQVHTVSVYSVDYDGASRSQEFTIIDFESGEILDRRTVSPPYTLGVWHSWRLSGKILFRLRMSGPPNAVVSGFFFGPINAVAEGGGITAGGSSEYFNETIETAGIAFLAGNAEFNQNIGFVPVGGVSLGSSAAITVIYSQDGTGAATIINPWITQGTPVIASYSSAYYSGPVEGIANITIDLPSGTVDGDLLVAIMVFSDSRPLNTIGAGFTLLYTASGNGGIAHSVYTKLASSEPSTYYWNLQSTYGPLHGVTLRISNAGGVDTYRYAVAPTTWTDSLTVSGLTLFYENSLAIGIHVNNGLASLTAGGYTTLYSQDNITGLSIVYKDSLTATTNSLTWNIGYGSSAGHLAIGPTVYYESSEYRILPTEITGGVVVAASAVDEYIQTSSVFSDVATGGILSNATCLDNIIEYETSVGGAINGGNAPDFSLKQEIGSGGMLNGVGWTLAQGADIQGNWIGTYGSDGYYYMYDSSTITSSLPPYIDSIAHTGTNWLDFTGAGTFTTDVRALTDPSGTQRDAGYFSATIGRYFDFNVTDSVPHQLAIYFLDWDNIGRVNDIRITPYLSRWYDNQSTTPVFNYATVSDFSQGKWVVINYRGPFTLFLGVISWNLAASGFFFDTPLITTYSLSSYYDGSAGALVGTTAMENYTLSETNAGGVEIAGMSDNTSYAYDIGTGSVLAWGISADNLRTYDLGSSGIVTAGDGVSSGNNDLTGSGGVQNAGDGLSSVYYWLTTDLGLILAGNSDFGITVGEVGIGGIVAQNNGVDSIVIFEVASGGMIASGIIEIIGNNDIDATGGMIASGIAAITVAANIEIEPGSILSGLADVVSTTYDSTIGGVATEGNSIAYGIKQETIGGTIQVAGSIESITNLQEYSLGGLVTAGLVDYALLSFMDGTSGVQAAGVATFIELIIPSGQVVISGATLITARYDESATGSCITGGILGFDFNEIGQGGILLNGNAAEQAFYTTDATGSVIAVGLAEPFAITTANGIGGIVTAGTLQFTNEVFTQGGITLSGNAFLEGTYNILASGNVLANTDGTIAAIFDVTPTGLSQASGSSDVNFAFWPSVENGVLAGAQVGAYTQSDDTAQGGTQVTSEVQPLGIYAITGQAGSVLSGDSLLALRANLEVDGSVITSGSSAPQAIYTEVFNGTALVGGTLLVGGENSFAMEGGATASGIASLSVLYNATVVGGSVAASNAYVLGAYSLAIQGGTLIEGTVNPYNLQTEIGIGGIVSQSGWDIFVNYLQDATGQIEINGTAYADAQYELFVSAGITTDGLGSLDVNYNQDTESGVVCDGESEINRQSSDDTSGGATTNGLGDYYSFFPILAVGGTQMAGESVYEWLYTVETAGELLTGGLPRITALINLMGDGGTLLGGTGRRNEGIDNFIWGGAVLGGAIADLSIKNNRKRAVVVFDFNPAMPEMRDTPIITPVPNPISGRLDALIYNRLSTIPKTKQVNTVRPQPVPSRGRKSVVTYERL